MSSATLLFAISVSLFFLALFLGGASFVVRVASTFAGTLSAVFPRKEEEKIPESRRVVSKRPSRSRLSPLAQEYVPLLYTDHAPNVAVAARRLADAKDRSSVPALCAALEQCVNAQRPGWRDAAASISDALSQIGDGRALPLLRELENVRGIGFIPHVRSAIARIEPQASLLRPGQTESAELLRTPKYQAEQDRAELLRTKPTD